MGCFRSIEEIMHWGGADAGSREQILRQADLRRRQRMANNRSPSGD